MFTQKTGLGQEEDPKIPEFQPTNFHANTAINTHQQN